MQNAKCRMPNVPKQQKTAKSKPSGAGLIWRGETKPQGSIELEKVNAQSVDLILTTRGVSSVGRAPALQAGGHRFDPGTLHQNGPIAQLARAHD